MRKLSIPIIIAFLMMIHNRRNKNVDGLMVRKYVQGKWNKKVMNPRFNKTEQRVLSRGISALVGPDSSLFSKSSIWWRWSSSEMLIFGAPKLGVVVVIRG